jgi:hypothetical protein
MTIRRVYSELYDILDTVVTFLKAYSTPLFIVLVQNMHRRSQTAQQVAGIVTFFTGMICLFVNTFVTGGMLKVRLFLYVSKWKKYLHRSNSLSTSRLQFSTSHWLSPSWLFCWFSHSFQHRWYICELWRFSLHSFSRTTQLVTSKERSPLAWLLWFFKSLLLWQWLFHCAALYVPRSSSATQVYKIQKPSRSASHITCRPRAQAYVS